MTDFFNWLSSNPIAATTLIVSFGVLVTTITLIYVIAFLQGRSISFWPPKIGEKPSKEKHIDNQSLPNTVESVSADTDFQSGPIVRKGTVLKTASGDKVTIESNFYGGATATLFRAQTESDETVIVKVFWRGLMPGSPSWVLFNQEQRTAEILVHRNS